MARATTVHRAPPSAIQMHSGPHPLPYSVRSRWLCLGRLDALLQVKRGGCMRKPGRLLAELQSKVGTMVLGRSLTRASQVYMNINMDVVR